MQSSSFQFLKDMLDSPGPSGYEEAPTRIWREYARSFSGEVHGDLTGNSYARVGTPGGPVVLIEGHIDEIGVIVTHVDDQGYLWFEQIGGWDDAVFVGQRIKIITEGGHVHGVIGRKAAHLIKQDSDKQVKSADLWIDIGATDRDSAKARVSVGDAAVIDAPFLQLTDDLVVSRSLDNRVGAFVAIEAARLLHESGCAADVYAVAAAQEEITFAGAATAAVQVSPMVAIAIDVTHASDYPNANKKSDGDVKLGGGPVLTRGSAINPVVFRGLRDAGQRLGLDCPVQGAARSTGTDADAMVKAGRGTACGLVSIPNRYMHSPNEVASLEDLVNAARLIADFVRTISADSDFRP